MNHTETTIKRDGKHLELSVSYSVHSAAPRHVCLTRVQCYGCGSYVELSRAEEQKVRDEIEGELWEVRP